METYSTVVIGGGAAGILAAISAGRCGESVVICEKTSQIGKKLLATGNGRCNLLNDNFNETFYNAAAKPLAKSIFDKFGKTEIFDFFKGLGLEVYSQEGRIFPRTNQASTVLKVLEMELKRFSVPVQYEFNCTNITFSRNRITVSSKAGEKIDCQKVVITGGGKSYPSFGSDGSTYEISKRLGHTIVEPVPSTVPLVVKDSLCQILQGQRIFASAKSFIDGKESEEIFGELLFTKYGLSGTCILDVSEEISIALNRLKKKDVFVEVDMVPFMDEEQLRDTLEKRRRSGFSDGDMLVGILPNKFGMALKSQFYKGSDNIIESLKNKRFKVTATRGWNEAEFTSGGVAVNEIKLATLESKLKKGVYFAGEVLDVNGKRGGYNLGWAWASGFVAGMTS